ncbi:hypothetical protein HWV62_5403 [Athelia sp. TMB]|nr:hypothetical protein HWV62_5403 [Athelia sp. TMB]
MPCEPAAQTVADAASGPATFNTIGTGESSTLNVAGNYISQGGDEGPVSRIARMLPYADGACWDSKLACLLGTRFKILSVIKAWAYMLDSPSILWLKGVAGSGKSAIAHTIARDLQHKDLCTLVFFFSRDIPSRNTPQLFLTNIARDLSRAHPGVAEDIAAALESEPALASAPLARQFEELILKPSLRLSFDRPILLIIDALDECIRDDLDTDLLILLRDAVTKLPRQFRILVTSRPTSNIDLFLSGQSHVMMHSLDIYSSESREDIAMYVDAQLRSDTVCCKMGPDWPNERMIHDLKQLAEGLFIWIATVCSYLRTVYKPRAKLQALLSKSLSQGLDGDPVKKMDGLYATILSACGDWQDADFSEDYNLVMGTIMAARRPLSLSALRGLHQGGRVPNPELLVQKFGSVLCGFHDPYEPIRILHLSFREFITDRAAHSEETRKFYISEKEHSGHLSQLCLRVMNCELAGPISGIGYLAKASDDSPGIPKVSGASEQLMYGCDQWTRHIVDVETPRTILRDIIKFLLRYLIPWMEVTTSVSAFHGSLFIRQWLQTHAPELRHLYNDQSQGDALFSLSHRLSYAARFREAVLASGEAAQLYSGLAAERPKLFGSNFAACLNNLSNRITELGQPEKALPIIQRAVALQRVQGSSNSKLAAYLTNLSNRLSDFGRLEEALVSIQEAVHLCRTLATKRPAAFSADLAAALYTLSNRLSVLGRREESLLAIQEALFIHRVLAARQPALFTADVAKSLNRLSDSLSSFCRREEALQVSQEATSLYRSIELQRPASYGPDLVRSLINLSNRFSDCGRREEALSAIQEAVELCRTLVTKRPAAFNAQLAASLNKLSTRLSDTGRREEALAAILEAVQLRRDLESEQPSAFAADLAQSLIHLSEQLSDFGRGDEALAAGHEAISLYQTIPAERAAAFHADLAHSHVKLSKHFSSVARRDEALASIQQAVNLYRMLAAARPAVFNADLAFSLDHLSHRLSELNRREEALGVVQEAVKLYRTLAEERPAAFTPDFASSLHNLSHRFADVDRREEALAVIKDAVHLRFALASERPELFKADLANSLHTLSDRLAGLGQREEALEVIRQAVRLRYALVTERPAMFNADLANSLHALYNRSSVLKRFGEALAAMQFAVHVYRALAADQPLAFNAKLSRSLSCLSDCFSELKRHGEALTAIHESVALYRALATEQPAFTAVLARSLTRLTTCLSEHARHRQ